MTDSSKTVLLVEDNEDNRTVYRTILEHFGYRVVEARNGEDGIRMAREDHPDLILMDISIPLVDGWEATRILKGDPATWGMGGSPTPLRAEFNSVSHKRGIVSMARTDDPDSASSQFFIMVADAPRLDNQYTVFGRVTQGMEVADKIVAAPTVPPNRPVEPITINSITIRDAREDEKGPATQ